MEIFLKHSFPTADEGARKTSDLAWPGPTGPGRRVLACDAYRKSYGTMPGAGHWSDMAGLLVLEMDGELGS